MNFSRIVHPASIISRLSSLPKRLNLTISTSSSAICGTEASAGSSPESAKADCLKHESNMEKLWKII